MSCPNSPGQMLLTPYLRSKEPFHPSYGTAAPIVQIICGRLSRTNNVLLSAIEDRRPATVSRNSWS